MLCIPLHFWNGEKAGFSREEKLEVERPVVDYCYGPREIV
jgi:hypothetical protein